MRVPRPEAVQLPGEADELDRLTLKEKSRALARSHQKPIIVCVCHECRVVLRIASSSRVT